MQSAKCEVRSAKCEVQSAKCKVQSARWEVQSAKCEVQSAKSEVQGAKFKVQGAKFKVQTAKCKLRSAKQAKTLGSYRSHFGSRYKSGRCDPRSPFVTGSIPKEVILGHIGKSWQHLGLPKRSPTAVLARPWVV